MYSFFVLITYLYESNHSQALFDLFPFSIIVYQVVKIEFLSCNYASRPFRYTVSKSGRRFKKYKTYQDSFDLHKFLFCFDELLLLPLL